MLRLNIISYGMELTGCLNTNQLCEEECDFLRNKDSEK